MGALRSIAPDRRELRCFGMIFLCFTLTSAVWLSWVYHLTDLVGATTVDLVSMGAGYLLQAAGCGTFALQYLMLGAYSGCFSQVFVIVRNLMLSKYNQWAWVRSKGWVPIFILIALIITGLTWSGPLSLIPLLVMVAGTVGLWTNNAGLIRLVGLVCISPPWIIYDALSGAYSAIINEVLVMVFVLSSIARFGWKQMIDTESDFQKQ